MYDPATARDAAVLADALHDIYAEFRRVVRTGDVLGRKMLLDRLAAYLGSEQKTEPESEDEEWTSRMQEHLPKSRWSSP